MTNRCARTASVLATVAVLAAPVAEAQDAAALATRRELIEQATQARDANDHARALGLAVRAAQISMTPSLRLFIAQEQRALGRLADALGNAEQCAREAQIDTSLRNRDVILATCQSLANELRPRVGRVVVSVVSPPPGLQVTVGGNPLREALWGVPYVVTPGRVTIEARAEGYLPFQQEIEVPPGRSVDVQVRLERSSEPSRSSSESSVAVSTPASSNEPQGPRARTGPGIGPFVVMGVGAAGLITFGVFAGLRAMTLDRCPDNLCPDQTTINTVHTYTTVANVSFIAGGVCLAGGLAWWLLGSLGRERPSSTAFQISPTGDGLAFTIRGRL